MIGTKMEADPAYYKNGSKIRGGFPLHTNRWQLPAFGFCELLEELNRKNSEICFLEFRKDGRQVKRKFFSSYKEAYMEMKAKYDTYFSVDYPNFAISKHSAFIHTFQNRLEWNLICSNPSETK